MQVSQGSILVATALLDDTIFSKCIILITSMDQEGATGFIINKNFDRKLNDLMEFSNSLPFNLYDGGPVEREALFFIHNQPTLIEGGTLVKDGIYFGGNFKRAVQHINSKTIDERNIKLFIGYCGWDAGELDAEVEEGSWEVMNMTFDSVFA